MSDERTKILQMLADGKISADEAAELLDASFPIVDDGGNDPIVMHREDEVIQSTEPKYQAATTSRLGFIGGWTNWANNLQGMRCDGAILDRAFFFANNLEQANFCDVDAESAKFFAANVDQANFEGANLRGARILCSNLDGANFRNANLEGVTIFASNFDSANLEGADLRGQSFIATNMDGFNVNREKGVDVEAKDKLLLNGPVSRM